jgi:hypothetical protein
MVELSALAGVIATPGMKVSATAARGMGVDKGADH